MFVDHPVVVGTLRGHLQKKVGGIGQILTLGARTVHRLQHSNHAVYRRRR